MGTQTIGKTIGRSAAVAALYLVFLLGCAGAQAAWLLPDLEAWAPVLSAAMAIVLLSFVTRLNVPSVLLGVGFGILVFPFGVFYLMGKAAGLDLFDSLAIAFGRVKANEWFMILLPLLAGLIAYWIVYALRNKRENAEQ